jgi:hypothetical protein
MARILFNDEWFEEIGSRGHYEAEFERVLEQEAERLFEKFVLVPFRTTVMSDVDRDARTPDFALIHKDYRGWWVVEVELGHHSFQSHVFPQVRTLARASYGIAEAEYLCEKRPTLDRQRVLDMFKGAPPRVLVIVNVPVDGWAEELRAFDAQVVVCQIFRNRLNKYVLRLNGEYPTESEEVITTCECESLMHRFLVVHAPARLPIQKSEKILIYQDGRAVEWERIDTAGRVYLHAMRDHTLEPKTLYELVRQEDQTLAIRPGVAARK